MTMITTISWPADLPRPIRESKGAQHGSPFLRTDMANGRARQRRRFSAVPSENRMSWVFTDAQCAAFESWFRDVLVDGTQWFNLTLKTPLGVDTALVCRFIDMYTGPDQNGYDRWRINARLEAFERPLLPIGWGEFPALVAQADIIDCAINQEWPEV